MNQNKYAPPRARVYILTDIAAFLIVLAVIALSVYPPGRALVQSAFVQPTPSATPMVVTPAPIEETPVPTPTLTLTPTPEPTPTPAPGDFSASFATAEIPEGMDYVYRCNDYLIGIEEYYVEDAVLFVADVSIRDVHLLQTAFSNGSFKGRSSKYENIVELCQDTNAMFAVSGDFVSIREDGLVIRNGELLQDNDYTDICVLYVDGTVAVYGPHDKTTEELNDGSVWQTWCFGPNLLDENGNAMEIAHKIARENPRCAIGYYAPGHYCFVVVDGRQKYYSDGMTLTELSTFMAGLGCKAAYNLDGGQTAQMVLDDNLVNMPANGGRRVGDIIYLGRTEDEG
ncbi:MAG: phosphodiester glycosidase family protein [Clostridiales bacterium]|nr:phosphodiester glycosidase family protein [Clostridiales bacterium]